MDIQTFKEWANQNQGLLAIYIFLATLMISLVSWFLKFIFSKFKKEKPFISAGGNITAGRDIHVGNTKFIQKSGSKSTNIQGENINLNKYGDNK